MKTREPKTFILDIKNGLPDVREAFTTDGEMFEEKEHLAISVSLPVREGTVHVTEGWVQHTQDSCPLVVVEVELQKARVWLTNNTRKKRTAKGLPRFLGNWLNNATTDQQKRGVRHPQMGGGGKKYQEW